MKATLRRTHQPVHRDGMFLPLDSCAVRSWTPEDAPAIARHADNRSVWLNLRDRFPHPYTRHDAEEYLRLVTAQRPESSFAIAVDGDAIGGVGLILGEDVHRRTAELGYWLGEAYWGRGIASEMVLGFSNYAFEHFDLLRLYAMPFAHNHASARVLEKTGFRCEGRLRHHAVKDGQVLDVLLYAKLKAEL